MDERRAPVVMRTYSARNLAVATVMFEEDAQEMSADGYSVAAQSWDQPSYARALMIVAILFFLAGLVWSLSFLIVGVALTFLAIVVRRDGTLLVTYQRPTYPTPAQTADPRRLARGPRAISHRRVRPPDAGL